MRTYMSGGSGAVGVGVDGAAPLAVPGSEPVGPDTGVTEGAVGALLSGPDFGADGLIGVGESGRGIPGFGMVVPLGGGGTMPNGTRFGAKPGGTMLPGGCIMPGGIMPGGIVPGGIMPGGTPLGDGLELNGPPGPMPQSGT